MYIILILLVLIILTFIFMPGYTPKIKNQQSKKSIAELKKIRIGDSEQWILIRSENIDNPVLLFLHGGPGTSQLTLMRKNTQPLEKYFIVVNWDQRGACKSFNAIYDKERMNINQYIEDVHELTLYLTKRFNKDKIILVGHSWGSAIGTLAVSRYPELFSAYIGIGQESNVAESENISYQWTLQNAITAGDDVAVKKLREIGPPPYKGNWKQKFLIERRLLGKFGGEYYGSKVGAFGFVIKNLIFSTEYTFVDRINFFRGIFKSLELLFEEHSKVNLFWQVTELKVPVWFMLGRHDFEVPSIISAQYFEALKAPAKTLYWFENSAHLPNTEECELFNKILIENILPFLQPAD